MAGLGIGELIVILVVVLLIFGANRIPQLGDAIGKGIRNFKKSQHEDDAIDVTPRPDEKLPPGAAPPPAATTDAAKKGSS
jgi:sec-independent protein translocase protein TatA